MSVNNKLLSKAFPYHHAVATDRPAVGNLNIIGVTYDGAASFRRGAAQGPDAIRGVSSELESYSPYFEVDLTELSPFFDLGNLTHCRGKDSEHECCEIQSAFAALSEHLELSVDGTRFLALGGDHSISYPFIKKYLAAYPDLLLVHLDAHADLRDGYQGNRFSHAAVIRRSLDHFGPGHGLVQFGIRSGSRDEYVWMHDNKSLCSSLDDLLHCFDRLPENRPVYLTLDLDFFDPAFLPGTGTPEPGGEDFHTFIRILHRLADTRFVGADVVELAPRLDPIGNSSIFAAKVVRELICSLQINSSR